jgi:hypothetical protein
MGAVNTFVHAECRSLVQDASMHGRSRTDLASLKVGPKVAAVTPGISSSSDCVVAATFSSSRPGFILNSTT